MAALQWGMSMRRFFAGAPAASQSGSKENPKGTPYARGVNARTMRFGRFELHPDERRLLVDGVPVTLGGRAFDLLLALADRPGRLVTKHHLLDLVWGDVVVGEANLTVHMSALRRVFGSEVIETVPGHGYRFVAALDAAVPPAPSLPSLPAGPSASEAPAPSPPRAAVGLPLDALPRAPLIGRDDDLAHLRATLVGPGCVTLAGGPGVGKTSLARAFVVEQPAGAVWIDLAALTESAQVEPALARALALPLPAPGELAALALALGARLLVLNNAEHLVDAAAALTSALLRTAPMLRVLVTSQWPLALPAERVHRVEPLGIEQGALALLVERAHAADHRFDPGAEAWPLLRAICARLDGVPLALEMAAARLPALGVKGVHDALERRFSLLSAGYRDAPGRHRTLRAALDWSHGLLAPAEQRLFRALGVFAGGATLQLVVAVAVDDAHDHWSVVDGLALLVERSLVATDLQNPPRYRLLETMRAYALERLATAGDEPAARRRLSGALYTLFEPATTSAAQRDAALAEYDNAREAIAWAVQHDPALAVRLAHVVSRATTFVSWRPEALAWLESCAAVVDDGQVRDADRALWWAERARQYVIGREPQASATARRAFELQRALGDEAGMLDAVIAMIRGSLEAHAELPTWCDELEGLAARHPEWPPTAALKVAGALAHACHVRGDTEGKLAQRLREHELATRSGKPLLADVAETNIVAALHQLGRDDEALARANALLARIGSQESLNVAFAWLGRIGALVSLNRWSEVRADVPRAHALMQRFRLPVLADVFAIIAGRQGRPRAAALLIGHAHSAYAAAGRALEPQSLEHLAEAEAAARAALGTALFERLVDEGRGLDDAAAESIVVAEGEPGSVERRAIA